MTEVWLNIPQNSAYQASSLGRIRSLDRVIETARGYQKRRGKILSPTDNGHGYLSVQLGRAKRIYVHILVMSAFYGLPPQGKEVNHKDLNKQNNSLENLEYVTRSENTQHMIVNGRHNKAKLTKDQRLEIRQLLSTGASPKALAQKFDVSKSSISCIANAKTWKWEL